MMLDLGGKNLIAADQIIQELGNDPKNAMNKKAIKNAMNKKAIKNAIDEFASLLSNAGLASALVTLGTHKQHKPLANPVTRWLVNESDLSKDGNGLGNIGDAEKLGQELLSLDIGTNRVFLAAAWELTNALKVMIKLHESGSDTAGGGG